MIIKIIMITKINDNENVFSSIVYEVVATVFFYINLISV